MKRKGPLLTLLGGLTLAVVLFVASVSAARDDAARRNAADNDTVGAAPGAVVGSGPAATAAPGPAAASGPAATAGSPGAVKATYAGRVTGAGTTILAIDVHNGKAVAYLCDGRTLERWYRGTAGGGKLTLAGAGGAGITATYGGGRATGTVTADGREWTFTAPTVAPPSGLYRATAEVRGARVVGGWIRLSDGSQTGMLRRGNAGEPAPPLDPNSNSVVVDGATLNASAVDAAAGL